MHANPSLKLLRPLLDQEEWINLSMTVKVSPSPMMAPLLSVFSILSIQLPRLLLILPDLKITKSEMEPHQLFSPLESSSSKLNLSLMKACTLKSLSRVTERLPLNAWRELRKSQSRLLTRVPKKREIF